MDNIEAIKNRLKNRSKIFYKRTSNDNVHPLLFKTISKVLITSVLVLLTLIYVRLSPSNEKFIYKNIYETNFKFASVNYYYKKYLGNILPFQNIVKQPEESVFNENLTYKEVNKYNNGAKLTVEDKYLVPIIESGIVVFVGDKENYGNTIIIQQTNGIDTWYGNVKNSNVQMYEYVEKGKLLGETEGEILYLVFQKEGKFLDYKEIIK